MNARAVALVALASTAGAATNVSSDPTPVVLSRVSSAQLTLTLDPELASATGELRVNVSVGAVGTPEPQPDGTVKVAYTPPTTKFPQVAIFGVWREGSAAPVEFIRLPLHGVTKIDASSKPGTEVSARVGDEVFGPTVANAKGHAPIAVVVPPGAKDTVLLAKVSGVMTQRTVPLSVPPYNRLAAAIIPISAAGEAIAALDVFYDTESRFDPRRLNVRASGGTAAFESAEGTRVRYRCTIPPGTSATFAVSAEGDSASKVAVSITTRELPAGVEAPTLVSAGPASQLPFELSLGARVGANYGFGAMVAPRFGLDAFAPFDFGGLRVAAGITLGYSNATQPLGPVGAPFARGSISLAPVSWRFSVLPMRFADKGTALGGVGLVTTFARYQLLDLQGPGVMQDQLRLTAGLTAYAGATWDVGPGHAFGELVFSWAVLEDQTFRAQAGGLGVEVGYRFDVFKPR